MRDMSRYPWKKIRICDFPRGLKFPEAGEPSCSLILYGTGLANL
jgi:hypothetical protein